MIANLEHIEEYIQFDDRLAFDYVVDHWGVHVVHEVYTADYDYAFQ